MGSWGGTRAHDAWRPWSGIASVRDTVSGARAGPGWPPCDVHRGRPGARPRAAAATRTGPR